MSANKLEEDLYDLISEISEEALCAGWAPGIEFELWEIVTGTERTLGQITLGDERVERLRDLSRALNGWMIYPVFRGHGPVVVPLDQWLEMFARWKSGASETDITG